MRYESVSDSEWVSERSHFFENTDWYKKKHFFKIFAHQHNILKYSWICYPINNYTLRILRKWNLKKIDVFSIKKGNATYEISLMSVLNWLGAMFLLLNKVTLCLINGWSHTLMFLEISDISLNCIGWSNCIGFSKFVVSQRISDLWLCSWLQR